MITIFPIPPIPKLIACKMRYFSSISINSPSISQIISSISYPLFLHSPSEFSLSRTHAHNKESYHSRFLGEQPELQMYRELPCKSFEKTASTQDGRQSLSHALPGLARWKKKHPSIVATAIT